MNELLIVKLFIGIAFGAIVGAISIPISKKLILKRSNDPGDVIPINGRVAQIVLVVVGLIAGGCLAATANTWELMIRNLLLLLPMLSISIVDGLIRKIPNPLLLTMIVVQAVYVIYYCIANDTTQLLISAGFGFFIGFACCTVPSILRIPVGAGDIKYSAVIGLCIYFVNYVQAMIIMGLLALVAYIFLKVTKKGGMKTLIPMGPFLSAGAVISICFPLLESVLTEVGVF